MYFTAWYPAATDSSIATATCLVADPHLTRFDELKAMSLATLARGELAAYQDRVSGCDGFLIRSWMDVGGYRQSVGHALRAGGCSLNAVWLRFCYPLDSEARSPANALGLMQILPATGRRLAAESGAADFSAAELYEPARNVALGTAYLRELHDRYGGNLPRVLAAYNAGEAAVDKWQRRYPDVEDDEFVESISYRETRGYVKRVLQNRRLYEALYGDGATQTSQTRG